MPNEFRHRELSRIQNSSAHKSDFLRLLASVKDKHLQTDKSAQEEQFTWKSNEWKAFEEMQNHIDTALDQKRDISRGKVVLGTRPTQFSGVGGGNLRRDVLSLQYAHEQMKNEGIYKRHTQLRNKQKSSALSEGEQTLLDQLNERRNFHQREWRCQNPKQSSQPGTSDDIGASPDDDILNHQSDATHSSNEYLGNIAHHLENETSGWNQVGEAITAYRLQFTCPAEVPDEHICTALYNAGYQKAAEILRGMIDSDSD